jgi:uncharacterized protein (TIGR04255 family)
VKSANKFNAVVTTGFAVQFKEELSTSIVAELVNLQSDLRSLLPNSVAMHRTKLELTSVSGSQANTAPSTEIIGLQFSSPATTSGSTQNAWEVRLDVSGISASCHEYSSWDKAFSFFKSVFDVFIKIPLVADRELGTLQLQVVDKFTDDSLPLQGMNRLFSLDCPFITENVRKSGELWHVHQGWIETLPVCGQTVCQVNLSSQRNVDTLDYFIDMVFVRLVQTEEQPTFSSLSKEATQLGVESLYNELHLKNKELLRKVITNERQDQIGLNKGLAQ